MIRLKKNKISLLLLLLPGVVFSQQFKYKCGIDAPDTTGFYSIAITPEISSHTQIDLRDLRIADSNGKWIPHLIRTGDAENKLPEESIDLKILSIEHQSRESIVIVENSARRFLNNFFIRLKNAAAERMSSLSGSDDDKKWFIISDSILLSQPLAYIRDENVKQINFPSTQYQYFKLTIRNNGKDPLNLLAIKSVAQGANYKINPLENPLPLIKQVDSANWTMLQVTNNEPYQVDQLAFEASRPALYERAARVFLQKSDGIVRTWEQLPVWSIEISSAHKFDHPFPLVKAKEFYIVISNEDNPPLEITSVRTFQPQRELVVYLEKGKTYELMLSDSNAAEPNYDLKEFAAKIPKDPQVLGTKDLVSISTVASITAETPGTWWIWITIVGVIFILAYLTWQLTREMRRKNKVS